jgi:3-deoxy-7-phosphoheptulonate synthase
MSSNTNIIKLKEIIAPTKLIKKYSLDESDIFFINQSRLVIENILHKKDKRLIVVVGPCSIHNYESAIEYANYLKKENSTKLEKENLYIVMRVYFEKPRSRLGWKGFIYDPDLDNTYDINKGLDLARKLLLEITKMRIPIGCEFLDTITPQYLSDLVSWGAIGARTAESQIHRQLASGLSMPIGFKNLTSGDYDKAIDGIISASYSHNFLGIDENGHASQVITSGNKNSHLILRGGLEPNYNQNIISKVSLALKKEEIATGIIVDCSHGNSQKDYNRQILVALYVQRLALTQNYPIRGIMLESNINKGNQKILINKNHMVNGTSVTDPCIDIITTTILLDLLNTMNVVEVTNLDQIRKLIRDYDFLICELYLGNNVELDNNAELSDDTELDIVSLLKSDIVKTQFVLEEDAIVAEMCKSKPNEELLLMITSLRLGLSEKVAELKFEKDPFIYLNSNNDILKLITDREIEKDNVRNSMKNDFYLKIMDLSKNIQVKYLEKYISNTKIGYLFGRGTFSHEVITTNFRGNHIFYENITKLKDALTNREIDFALVPTYNSLIGEIFHIKAEFQIHGSIDHKIELCVYSNKLKTYEHAEILYIEPHIYAECKKFIDANFDKKIEIVKVETSLESCLRVIKNDIQCCFTISSKNNDSNFLYKIASNVVEHNISTFTIVSL